MSTAGRHNRAIYKQSLSKRTCFMVATDCHVDPFIMIILCFAAVVAAVL